jgi:hypothetical protein
MAADNIPPPGIDVRLLRAYIVALEERIRAIENMQVHINVRRVVVSGLPGQAPEAVSAPLSTGQYKNGVLTIQ